MNFYFFSFFLWVFKCWPCFLLRFCWLWSFRITDFILVLNYCLLLNFELLKYLLFSGKLFLSQNELNFRVHFSVVNQKICTFTVLFLFPFEIILKRWWHSTETLSLNTVNAEKTDQWIVELKPLILFCLNKRDIMPWFCVSNMHNYASQFVIILTNILWLLLWRFLSVKMLQTVWINIEFNRELMFTCDFFIYESVQIKNDSLKMDDQYLRWFGNSGHFWHVDFLVTKITFVIIDYLT